MEQSSQRSKQKRYTYYINRQNLNEDALFVKDPHQIHRKYAIWAVYILTLLIATPLSVNAYFDGHTVLSYVLASVSLASLLNFYLIFRGKLSYERSADLALIPLFALMLYLVVSGGIEETGPLWIFTLPATVLFLYGTTKGLISLFLFAIGLVIALYLPHFTQFECHYTEAFKHRLIFIFVLVVLLTLTYAFTTQRLFRQLYTLTQKVSHIAKEDQLTSILNRRGGMEILSYYFEHFVRHHEPFSLIMIDIDFFKHINDRYGHQVGDEVLKSVADTIHSTIRNSDFAIRWGGEEFVVILPQTTKKEAFVVAEKVRKVIHKSPIKVGHLEISLSVSIGFVDSFEADSIDGLLHMADERLYRAKKNGKNTTVPSL